jgi:DNA invertase Pin-like site-specific DNA recombinase
LLRVSDERQTRDGDPLETQRASLQNWAKTTGETISGFLYDKAPGTVEALTDRDGLATAIGYIKSHQACGIVVARLDRLARDLTAQEFLIREIHGHGAALASALPEEQRVLEGDGEDPQRVFIRQLFGAMAQYDRAMLKIRMQSGRMRRRAENKWNGGTVPYGFRVDASERLVLEPREAGIIARGMTLRIEGVTFSDIGEYFSEAGMRTHRAPHWSPKLVSQCLDKSWDKGIRAAPLDRTAERFVSKLRHLR